MTFTKTPPTVAGFYAWREFEADEPIPLEVWMGGGMLQFKPRHSTHAAKYGQWCRLVPSEEVEKAFFEGFDAGNIEAGFDAGNIESANCWNNSRAKRVAEGME